MAESLNSRLPNRFIQTDSHHAGKEKRRFLKRTDSAITGELRVKKKRTISIDAMEGLLSYLPDVTYIHEEH